MLQRGGSVDQGFGFACGCFLFLCVLFILGPASCIGCFTYGTNRALTTAPTIPTDEGESNSGVQWFLEGEPSNDPIEHSVTNTPRTTETPDTDVHTSTDRPRRIRLTEGMTPAEVKEKMDVDPYRELRLTNPDGVKILQCAFRLQDGRIVTCRFENELLASWEEE